METFLQKLKDYEYLIVVEGKKDENALSKLGVKNIVSLNKPLYKFVEEISFEYKKVTILTDLDKQGKKIYKTLKHTLQERGIKIDDRFRKDFFSKTRINHIENLSKFLD